MSDYIRLVIGAALAALLMGQTAPAAERQDSENGEAATGEEQPAGSGIYRGRDEQGNVIFTDDPQRAGSGETEEVELKNSNTLPMRVPEGALAPPENLGEHQQKALDYTINIVSPSPEENFHNPGGPIPVQVEVTPNPTEGHALVIEYDGVALDKAEIPWPQDRGTHTLTVNVVDRDNNVLETASRTFFVHRASKLLPPKK